MLASLVFPIVYDGKAIGIVASDIVLDKLQEMVSRVNPRSQGGYTEILSNSGVIVAHPDKRYLGKDLVEQVMYHTLTTGSGKAGQAARLLEQGMASRAGGEDTDTEASREHTMNLVRNLKAYAGNPVEGGLDLALFTPELAETILASNERVRAAVAEVRTAVKTGQTHIVRSQDFYTVYTPIQFSEVTMPWSVAVSIPMSEVMLNAQSIRNYAIVVSFAAICAIACILYLISRSVTWPILVLAKAAKTIGEGDLKTRIPEVGGGNEIGTLAGALRFMVDKNEALIGEMQGYAEKLEEKNQYLNRLNELKDEFLANTSHELRTPIHGIIGIAESMIEGATGPLTKEQKYNLAIVSNSGKRLSNMINDILDFTKLKNKEIALQLKPVDLKTIVDTVLVLSKPLIKGRNLKFEDCIDDSFPLVEADEGRMQQVLYNLIGNAVKFTEKGDIRVSAEVRDGMAAVSVSDTGIGIPESKFDLIFESFEQVDGSTEREYGGTGLGLPISRKLVELHGGTLTVSSKIDKGSVFTFTVPLSRAKKELAGQAEKPGSIVDMDDFESDVLLEEDDRPSAEPGDEVLYRILAVDDEPVNIQVLKNLLRIRNCSISTAYSGIEALKRLESGEKFDLILLDVMMPKMSGYEVCRKIRQEHSLFELPILMLTAKNQLQDIVLGFQSGANDYLSKPFDKAELLARVRTLLSLKRAVTSAIQNEKLFENEKHKRIMEQTLLEVTNAITSTLDLKEVLVRVLEAMSHFIRFSKSLVVLNENERFEVAVVGGDNSGAFREGMNLDVSSDAFLKEVVASERPVLGDGIDSSLQGWQGDGEMLAGVPIIYRGALLGIIVLAYREENLSRELLFTLAGQAGVAIQNARMFSKINVMATTDGLTGLYNRRYFFELVEKEFAKYKRYGDALTACMIDIDHFKRVNDTYGHAAGDEVLRHLARKFNEMFREYDIIGRYGGEEFAVVFPGTSLDGAARIMERIRSSIENTPLKSEEFGEIPYTLSIGISEFTKDSKDVQGVFEEADKGLYEAKSTGRNRVVVRANHV